MHLFGSGACLDSCLLRQSRGWPLKLSAGMQFGSIVGWPSGGPNAGAGVSPTTPRAQGLLTEVWHCRKGQK